MGFERVYDYDDVPTLREFANSNHFFRLAIGCFGSGKSSACVAEMIARGIQQAPNKEGIRRTRWAIVRNTVSQLVQTTQKTVYDWVPPDYFGIENKTNHTYIINKIALEDGTKVEIELIFRALDDANDVRNLLSLELTGAWLNELREIPKVITDAIEGRVGRYPSEKEGGCTWFGVIADTNPPDHSSYIFKLFEEELPKSEELQSKYAIFKQPSGRSDKAENLKYLPKDYYKTMAIGKDPEFIKVYIDGEYGYIRDGKPVYSNYMDSVHCAEKDIEAMKGVPILLGLDFGLSPACTLAQYLPNGKLNILKEFWEDNCGLRAFMTDIVKPYLVSKYRGWEIVTTGDPAGIKRGDTDERTCFMELASLGFPATPAPTNSLLARINAVDVFLTKMVEGKPAFQLSPCCELLRRGFIGEYKLHKFRGANEHFSEIPLKNDFSHLADSLQYIALIADRGLSGVKGLMGSRYDAPASSKSKPASMAAWT